MDPPINDIFGTKELRSKVVDSFWDSFWKKRSKTVLAMVAFLWGKNRDILYSGIFMASNGS
jgi:hypothetical protein